jgi:hypothetical protein
MSNWIGPTLQKRAAMYRIALITTDSTLASIFDPVLRTLEMELVIATRDSDLGCVNVDLLLWHDRDAIGCVPTHLAALGVPVMHLAPSGQSQSQRVGSRCPSGYQPADYYLVYPFDSEDAVTIFCYWLERSQRHRQDRP